MTLFFSRGNNKLNALESVVNGEVWTFSLLSGWTCPHAKDCLSKVVIGDDNRRHVKDGPHTQFRCFSASQEALFSHVYRTRKENFEALRALGGNQHAMCELIFESLPTKARYIRIHVGGDFFNERYFRAWADVASLCKDRTFYAYTKSLQYWVDNRKILPENFVLTASRGGTLDHLIDKYKLRECKVVFSIAEAYNLGLEIDNDDSHAALPYLRDTNFALLIHGTQPKGTKAAEALKKLDGLGTYGRGAKT